ncbi:MAG: transketolase [Armatimonadetes bacterium]|nr:transketolase [Armatimonadota bacterium]MDE2205283.1 transketolase [Armatimonadota bacterium]
MAYTAVDWKALAAQLRADSIRSTTAAGSGHPTSSMSAADLMAVLLSSWLNYDFNNPHNPLNDRLIFSKGHAAPLLYSMYKAAGAITDAELLTLRKYGSRIEGHPTPELPWVDVATGSLGQGLPTAIGLALAARLDKLPSNYWVLMGDSETAEGSVWEGFELAGFYRLGSITAILDMNRLGQRGPTMLQWEGDHYVARAEAFGWNAFAIDGHSVEAVDEAYRRAVAETERPTLIVAKTEKGAGVSFLANKEGWHGKALSPDEAERALVELGSPAGNVRVTPPPAHSGVAPATPAPGRFEPPKYDVGSKVATREAYGDGLHALGASDGAVVAFDGEVSNSTFSDRFKKEYPQRFFECYIAEQQLVSAAVGAQILGKKPFASTFAAFFSRAFDQIRMAAISRANIRLAGSHAGVSIGEDGPSQMALEDLAMMRTVHGSTVLYPSCATTAAALVGEMANRTGVVYMRTTREKLPVIYGAHETFAIGGSKVLRRSDSDAAAVIAAGITLYEALAAYETLHQSGLNIRVIDLYSLKPLDAETLFEAARDCAGRLIVVEDHWPEGGIADAVCEAFDGRTEPRPVVTRMAVRSMPGSGKPAELLDAAGISARHIVEMVRHVTG